MFDFVYVLVCDNHLLGELENVEIIGVYDCFSKAEEKMKEEIENFKKDKWVLDEQYEDGDMAAIMFYEKQENWNEHFELAIFEREVE